MGKMKIKISDELLSDNKAEEGYISCTTYVDSTGRIYLSKRIRDRAGLTPGVGYEFEMRGRVLSSFKETIDE